MEKQKSTVYTLWSVGARPFRVAGKNIKILVTLGRAKQSEGGPVWTGKGVQKFNQSRFMGRPHAGLHIEFLEFTNSQCVYIHVARSSRMYCDLVQLADFTNVHRLYT